MQRKCFQHNIDKTYACLNEACKETWVCGESDCRGKHRKCKLVKIEQFKNSDQQKKRKRQVKQKQILTAFDSQVQVTKQTLQKELNNIRSRLKQNLDTFGPTPQKSKEIINLNKRSLSQILQASKEDFSELNNLEKNSLQLLKKYQMSILSVDTKIFKAVDYSLENQLRTNLNVRNDQYLKLATLFKQKKIDLKQGKIIYNTKTHGSSFECFKEACSKNQKLVFLFRSDYDLFGGFSSYKWVPQFDDDGFIKDDKAFLFSVTKSKLFNLKKPKFAMCLIAGYGPVFGGDLSNLSLKYFDLAISQSMQGTSKLGINYQAYGQTSITSFSRFKISNYVIIKL